MKDLLEKIKIKIQDTMPLGGSSENLKVAIDYIDELFESVVSTNYIVEADTDHYPLASAPKDSLEEAQKIKEVWKTDENVFNIVIYEVTRLRRLV